MLFSALLLSLVVVMVSQQRVVEASPDPDWYNASWGYRKQITIDNAKVKNENWECYARKLSF